MRFNAVKYISVRNKTNFSNSQNIPTDLKWTESKIYSALCMVYGKTF